MYGVFKFRPALALCAALPLAACGPSVSAPDDAHAGIPDASVVANDGPIFPDATPRVDALDIDAPAGGPVTVSITADNAYSFGYGDVDSITHFTPGARAQTAGQIFNCPVGVGPEKYVIAEADAPDNAFLYVVSWDDLAVTQGVLGQFKRSTSTLYTGDPAFQVCATGLDYSGDTAIPPGAGDPTSGPTLDVINAQITKCNAGSGDPTTTSAGWVTTTGAFTPGANGSLAVGEANDASGGSFQIVCQSSPTNPDGIDAMSHWMWYLPNDGENPDAFHSNGTNRFKAFLIFRLPVVDIHIGRGKR